MYIYRGNAFIAFISFIAFVGDRRLYFGVYRVYFVTRPYIDVTRQYIDVTWRVYIVTRPNIDAPVDIISCHVADSMRASPEWLLVVNRGSLNMRALPVAPRQL